MSRAKKTVSLPPLREYEIPEGPSVVLHLPPQRDTFTVPGERMTAADDRELARPVAMPPLHPAEEPGFSATVFTAVPDPRSDEPDWGAATRAPDLAVRGRKLLRPWDD